MGKSISYELIHPSGEQVFSEEKKADEPFSKFVEAPLKWSAEEPNLYLLYMTVKDADGKTIEIISQHVGFRSIVVSGETFLVNGVAIKFKG